VAEGLVPVAWALAPDQCLEHGLPGGVLEGAFHKYFHI
jgi:hypothetical protein